MPEKGKCNREMRGVKLSVKFSFLEEMDGGEGLGDCEPPEGGIMRKMRI